jgi:FixJ family two-component response regulator
VTPQELDPVVFVVEDDRLVRQALTGLIRSVGLRAEPMTSAQEFLQIRRGDEPACLVLDVRLPGLNGLDLQRVLVERGQEIPIIFISGHADVPMTVQAMKAGAVEFLPKPFREQDLLDAIWQALQRDRSGRLHRAEVESIRRRREKLTSREIEVLAGVVAGKLNKQIAAELGISEMTVKVHRRHMMEKMGADSLAELVRMIDRLS